MYSDHLQAIYKMIKYHVEDPSESRQSAYMLCYEMDWAFDSYYRMGTKQDRRIPVRSLNGYQRGMLAAVSKRRV